MAQRFRLGLVLAGSLIWLALLFVPESRASLSQAGVAAYPAPRSCVQVPPAYPSGPVRGCGVYLPLVRK